jgi:hypothetical protein
MEARQSFLNLESLSAMRLRYLDGQRDCWTTYMKHAECSEAAMHISQISVCRILYGTNTKGLSFPMRICGSRPRYGSRSYPHGVDWCDGGANSTYEPNRTSLCVQAAFRPTLHPAHHLISLITAKMTTTPPPLDFDHEKGFEIPIKHKKAIRQLH